MELKMNAQLVGVSKQAIEKIVIIFIPKRQLNIHTLYQIWNLTGNWIQIFAQRMSV